MGITEYQIVKTIYSRPCKMLSQMSKIETKLPEEKQRSQCLYTHSVANKTPASSPTPLPPLPLRFLRSSYIISQQDRTGIQADERANGRNLQIKCETPTHGAGAFSTPSEAESSKRPLPYCSGHKKHTGYVNSLQVSGDCPLRTRRNVHAGQFTVCKRPHLQNVGSVWRQLLRK